MITIIMVIWLPLIEHLLLARHKHFIYTPFIFRTVFLGMTRVPVQT